MRPNATRVTDSYANCIDTMLWQIAHRCSCNPTADLLPEIDEIQKVSKLIAFKVAKAAMDAGVAPIISDEQLQHAIEKNFWKPEYRHYKRVAF